MLMTRTAAPPKPARAPRRHAPARARLTADPLAVLAHELKTPLSAIIGLGQVLLAPGPDEPLSPEQRAIAGQIVVAGQTLLRLLTDLLDLIALRRDWLAVSPTPTDAVALAVECARHMAPLAAARQQSLTVLAEPGVAPALADPDRLRQVLVNLLANAIAYTTVQGDIAVIVRRGPAETTDVGVRDDGPGLSPEALEQAFAPPDQPGARRGHGLGLGLALVRAIAEAHGGWAWAESVPGVGSVFWVRLPSVPPDRH